MAVRVEPVLPERPPPPPPPRSWRRAASDEVMHGLNRERGLTYPIVTRDSSVGRKTERIVRMVDGASSRSTCWR